MVEWIYGEKNRAREFDGYINIMGCITLPIEPWQHRGDGARLSKSQSLMPQQNGQLQVLAPPRFHVADGVGQ